MTLHRLFLLKTRYGTVDKRVSNVARRAELALYTRANSLEEYSELKTLFARIQALIRKLHANRITSGVSFSCAPMVLGKRTSFNDDLPQPKQKRTKRQDPSNLLESLCSDVLGSITQFLDQRSVVYMCCVNEGGYSRLPLLLRSLVLREQHLASISPDKVAHFLDRWKSVQSITVSGQVTERQHPDADAELLSPMVDVSSTLAIRNLMCGLRATHLPRLEILCLNYTFTDDLSDRTTAYIAKCLSNGACPNLQKLSLRGNCVSDDGAEHLAKMIYTGSCRKLKHLDIEHNAIGEWGGASLSQAIGQCLSTKLQVVNVAQNFIGTDRVKHLQKLVQDREGI